MTERIQNFKFYYPPGYKHVDQADQQQQQQQSFILVLIHGLNGNLLTWTPNLAPKLAAATGMRIVTFDQPCYGQNPLPFKQMEELEVEDEEENENDDNKQQTQEADPIQDMITKLDSIMTPSNLAVELFKFLQAVKVIPTIAEQQQQQQQEQEQQSSPMKQLKKQIKRPFIHVLGQSFGGKTAIAFADKYPFLVASLTLGDIGICPCNKYDHKTAHDLAAQFFLRHIESFPDEESVKNLHSVFANDGGDDVGKKYTFDTKTQSWVTLVRPHVGFIHDYHSRKADLRDAWMDFEGPVMAIRAGDEHTCLSDQEWRLMKDLRRQAQPEVHAELDCFVTPSSEGFHGVYRSHEDLFVNVYSEFVEKTSSS